MKKAAVLILLLLGFGGTALPAHAYHANNNGVAWDWYYANSISIMTGWPSSQDYSYYAPPVGNQDPNNIGFNSCSAWTAAEDHYWLSKFDYSNDNSPGFAPMYTYTRLDQGSQRTSTAVTDNFYYFVAQGTYPINSYPSLSGNGNTWDARWDYYQQPGQTNNYKLTSYGWINNNNGGNFTSELKELIYYAYPVILVIPYYNDIAHVTSPNYLVTGPASDRVANTSHAVFATKYDSNGVWFQNSYGTAYGKSGWAELSWSYLANYVTDLFWAWDAKGSDIFTTLGQASAPTVSTAAPAPGAEGPASMPTSPVLGGRGISDDGVTTARAALPGTPAGDPRFGGRDLAPGQANSSNTFVVGPPLGPRPSAPPTP
jgi:hypothetical protein